MKNFSILKLCTLLFNKPSDNHITFCIISEYKMMDGDKISDDEMLQNLQMLPQGGKQVRNNKTYFSLTIV